MSVPPGRIPCMTTANTTPGCHPIAAAVACLHAQLDDLHATFWTMTAQDLAATLPALTRLRQRVTSLELSTAHAANTIGLGTEIGAADTGAYWANTTRQPKGIAKHRLKLAAALDKHETTRVAMAEGRVAEDQAAVIIEAVEQLPTMQAEAEAHLVALAAEHDATALAILGKHVLEVVAPDLADQHLQRTLEREEERAQEPGDRATGHRLLRPQDRLRSRDHPGRPRREVGGPGPGTQSQVPHRTPTDRAQRPRPGLH